MEMVHGDEKSQVAAQGEEKIEATPAASEVTEINFHSFIQALVLVSS